jgi:hypothetical protein
MKKILLVLVMLFTFSFVACDNAETTTLAPTTLAPTTAYDYSVDIAEVDNDLQAQIDDLELQIGLLQDRINNIVVTEGLNGQYSYYENQLTELNYTLSLLTSQTNSTYFDSTLAPNYTYDENGDYITAFQLMNMLRLKYFSELSVTNGSNMEAYMLDKLYIYLLLDNGEGILSPGDIIARMILLTEELSHYDHYMLSCPFYEINMLVLTDGYNYEYNLKIPLTVMLNDYFTITAGSILDGGYEMYLNVNIGVGLNVYVKDNVYTYYDAYALDNTFTGYVLNYIE